MNLDNCERTIENYLQKAQPQVRIKDQSWQEPQLDQTRCSIRTYLKKALQMSLKLQQLHQSQVSQCFKTQNKLCHFCTTELDHTAYKDSQSLIRSLRVLFRDKQLHNPHALTQLLKSSDHTCDEQSAHTQDICQILCQHSTSGCVRHIHDKDTCC